MIELPKRGTLNIHASLLPTLRGAAPIQAAIRDGHTRTGVTIMRMALKLDAGPIILQLPTDIIDDETGGEFEIAGALGGLQGTCPSVSFNVNGYRITTSGSTTFEGGACSTLKSGNQVEVKGVVQADGSVAATRVKKH